jgi:HEAT repeat protein
MRTKLIAALIAGVTAVSACALAGEDDDPKIKGKPVSKLIAQLRGNNRGLQVRAARALAEAPKELHGKIAPKLIPVLKSDRENDKFVAAQTLGQYGPVARAAVPDLLPMLEGTQFERNRAAAAKALGQILKDAKPSEEVDKVTKAILKKINENFDQYPDVRREAAKAIGMIGPAAKSAIPKMKKALTDFAKHDKDKFQVRMAAAWTLGRMGPDSKEYMDRLISMLHGEIDLATHVVWAIGRIGPLNENVVTNVMDRLEKVLTGAGFRVGPYSYQVENLSAGTRREYLDHCFATLASFGKKSKVAVPLMIRCISEGKWTASHRIGNAVGAFRVLKAVGPDAKEALPALEAAAKVTRFDQRIPKETVEAFKSELKAALEAVKK